MLGGENWDSWGKGTRARSQEECDGRMRLDEEPVEGD